MKIFRKTLEVAKIKMSVESQSEFEFSDRCKPFEKKIDDPQVKFYIYRSEGIDFSKYKKIYDTKECEILCDNSKIAKIVYADNRKNILWYMIYDKKLPDVYNIYIERKYEKDFLEINPFYFLSLSEFLINYDAIMLHGAVIEYKNRGIVFTAPSGTGKSTQANLWNKYYGVNIINGDRAIVRKEFKYRVYGSPYAGSSKIYKQESSDLAAIIILKQAKENKVHCIGKKEAYMHIMSQISVSPWNKKVLEKQMDWIVKLINTVPTYILECLPNKEAVDVLYNELRYNKKIWEIE